MRAKGATIQQILLATALLAGVCWNLARAEELRDIRVASGPTGTRAELQLDREVRFDVIRLAGPERLVIDLPGTALRKGLAMPSGTGLVQGVRSGHPVPGTTRIVFDLADKVAAIRPHYEQGAAGPRLVLEWPGERLPPATPAVAGTASAADPLAILTQGAASSAPPPAGEPPAWPG